MLLLISYIMEKRFTKGDSLQKGSVIDLVLGKGLSNQRTPVPDLIGMNLDPAKNKILVSSLNLGTFIYDNTIINGQILSTLLSINRIRNLKMMPLFSLDPQYISGLQLIQLK